MIRELFQYPRRYDFFAAIRLLQSFGEGARVGSSLNPSQEPCELLQLPSLVFIGSSVEGIRFGPKPILLVRGLGLFGQNGPLPFWLTNFAQHQQSLRQSALLEVDSGHLKSGEGQHPFWTESAFVALCHLLQQRFLAFLYRAWELQHLAPALDRLERAVPTVTTGPAEDHLLPRCFLALSGFLALEQVAHSRSCSVPTRSVAPAEPDASPSWESQYHALWKSVAFHTGRLVPTVRNPEGLRAILECEFGVNFEIIEFIPRWVRVPVEDRCLLGGSGQGLGEMLGDAVVGEFIRDCQTQFRIRVGPLTLEQYRGFLPGRPEHARLRNFVSLYCGDDLDYDLQLVLRREQVPGTPLWFAPDPGAEFGAAEPGTGAELGWTTWLQPEQEPLPQDADDLVLEQEPAGLAWSLEPPVV
jgi:type VI secretion system protein ImpH